MYIYICIVLIYLVQHMYEYVTHYMTTHMSIRVYTCLYAHLYIRGEHESCPPRVSPRMDLEWISGGKINTAARYGVRRTPLPQSMLLVSSTCM